MELLVARNPDSDSTLPYLLRLPLGNGMVFRAKDTWPRTNAIYCHPVPAAEWPGDPEIVERVPLRVCHRRGMSIDIVADRSREHRSQIVFTRARGRDVVFWQSPRTAKQSRPAVRIPKARGSGVADLVILVDAHEHYPYRFSTQQVEAVRRPLRCGDYAVERGGRILASVERKSLEDLISSLTSGRLGYALGELAGLPRAAIVVEDRYSKVFSQTRVRPAIVADGICELQVRWPSVPIVWCESRKLAEEWTYRYLAAAYAWADTADDSAGPVDEPAGTADEPVGPVDENARRATGRTAPSESLPVAEIRQWAREHGVAVSDRGRISAGIIRAWTTSVATTKLD